MKSDDDQFDDSIRYDLDKDSELYLSLVEAQKLVSSMTIQERYKNKVTGEIIDLSDYKKVREIVCKQ